LVSDLPFYGGEVKAATVTRRIEGHELWIHLEAHMFPHRKFLLPVVRNKEELLGATLSNERIVCESINTLENRYEGHLISIDRLSDIEGCNVISLGGYISEWDDKVKEKKYFWGGQPFPAKVDHLIMHSGYFYPSFKKHPKGLRKPQARCNAGLSNPVSLKEFLSWMKKDGSGHNQQIEKMREYGGELRLYGGGHTFAKRSFHNNGNRNLTDIWLLHMFHKEVDGCVGCWTFFGCLQKYLSRSLCVITANKVAFRVEGSDELECFKVFDDEENDTI